MGPATSNILQYRRNDWEDVDVKFGLFDYIKTQLGEREIDTVVIYVSLIRTVIPEALLEFVILLQNIIRGQDLSTGP